MTTCEYCDIKEKKGPGRILFEDEQAIVAVKDTAVTPGQLTVFPKEHFTILEMVPEPVLHRCSILANNVSIATFEGLGSQGTNILVRNGLGAGQTVAHFALEIIPRQEGDALSLEWTPKPLTEPEMETTSSLLQQELKQIETEGTKKVEKKQDPKTEIVEDEKKENYLLRSIWRIP